MTIKTTQIFAAEAGQSTWELDGIVQGLRLSREVTNKTRASASHRELPSREILAETVENLCTALFPTHYGRPDLSDESIDYFVGNLLNTALSALSEQARRSLLFTPDPDELKEAEVARRALEITRDFGAQLPAIRALLYSDLMAAYQGDPAATNVSEILLSYPGMTAIIYYRLGHALHRLGVPFLARLIAGIAHSKTGIDIHPGAQIGGSFFIDHGTGVVIGETAIIGERVRLYQAVTLGAKRFPADEHGILIKGNARHPIIEDNVVIYAGATVLGRITVGRDSTIGGNVWLTQSVPPGSNITQAQMRND